MQDRTVGGLCLDRYQAELSKLSGAVEVVMSYCRSAHRRRACRTWSHRSDLEIEALSLVSLVGGCERTRPYSTQVKQLAIESTTGLMLSCLIWGLHLILLPRQKSQA